MRTYDHSQGLETQKDFLTNQTTAHKTMLQTTDSLCDKDKLSMFPAQTALQQLVV